MKSSGEKVVKASVGSVGKKPALIYKVAAILGAGIALVIFGPVCNRAMMKNSDSYKVAISTIEYDQQIRNETGGIKGYGMIPDGEVKVTNGFGQAQYEIKVLGNKKDMKVWVALEKEANGAWRVIGLQK